MLRKSEDLKIGKKENCNDYIVLCEIKHFFRWLTVQGHKVS